MSESANQRAVESMIRARPVLKIIDQARTAIPSMTSDMLLHAGPPLAWDEMSGPLRGAIVGALVLEDKARSESEALELAASGEIRFEPCHHHGAAGPMAGVISPSMAVYVVEDESSGQRSYSNLNEGYGKVLRYGAFAPEVLERLRWINGPFADALRKALELDEGLDLRALLAESLHMGDEGHNRNRAGSLVFLRHMAPRLARVVADGDQEAEILSFLGDNALSVLNPVMAACKLMADLAHGVEHSTLVTAMSRNGTHFGIRVSGLGDRWFTAPAPVPDGRYFDGFSREDANADIGDSTITETVGIGGFAMAAAPAIVEFISGTPQMALKATEEMYAITVAEHEHFTIPALDFRGTPTGIDVQRVVETGITPRVNTGIAHREPGIGQIGAGLVRPPMEVFEAANEALGELSDRGLGTRE